MWAAVPEEWAAATDSSGRQGASGERRQDRFWCNYPAIFPKPWEGGAGVPPPITATDHFPFGFTVWVPPSPHVALVRAGHCCPTPAGRLAVVPVEEEQREGAHHQEEEHPHPEARVVLDGLGDRGTGMCGPRGPRRPHARPRRGWNCAPRPPRTLSRRLDDQAKPEAA